MQLFRNLSMYNNTLQSIQQHTTVHSISYFMEKTLKSNFSHLAHSHSFNSDDDLRSQNLLTFSISF